MRLSNRLRTWLTLCHVVLQKVCTAEGLASGRRLLSRMDARSKPASPLSPETHETHRAGRGAEDSGQRPRPARPAVERFTSTARPMPLAIRPHSLECLRPFKDGSLGDAHQLADAESPDERGSGEIREVVLCVLGQMQKAEHLRHSRFAKALLLTNLNFGQRLVFIQTPLPVEHSPDGMPRRHAVPLRGLFRQAALRRGFERELERLRHERRQIVLVVGKAQNELEPEGSS